MLKRFDPAFAAGSTKKWLGVVGNDETKLTWRALGSRPCLKGWKFSLLVSQASIVASMSPALASSTLRRESYSTASNRLVITLPDRIHGLKIQK